MALGVRGQGSGVRDWGLGVRDWRGKSKFKMENVKPQLKM